MFICVVLVCHVHLCDVCVPCVSVWCLCAVCICVMLVCRVYLCGVGVPCAFECRVCVPCVSVWCRCAVCICVPCLSVCRVYLCGVGAPCVSVCGFIRSVCLTQSRLRRGTGSAPVTALPLLSVSRRGQELLVICALKMPGSGDSPFNGASTALTLEAC